MRERCWKFGFWLEFFYTEFFKLIFQVSELEEISERMVGILKVKVIYLDKKTPTFTMQQGKCFS